MGVTPLRTLTRGAGHAVAAARQRSGDGRAVLAHRAARRRFRDKLRALLKRDGLPERVITIPDLDDTAENQARLQLLTQHREYGTRTGLFRWFPRRRALAVDGHLPGRASQGPVYRLRLLGRAVGRHPAGGRRRWYPAACGRQRMRPLARTEPAV